MASALAAAVLACASASRHISDWQWTPEPLLLLLALLCHLLVAAHLTLICWGVVQAAPAQAASEGPVAFDLQNGFNPQAVLRISVRGGLVLTAEAVKELPRDDVAHIWKVKTNEQCLRCRHLADIESPHSLPFECCVY